MKNICLLLILSLFIASCNKEESEEEISGPTYRLKGGFFYANNGDSIRIEFIYNNNNQLSKVKLFELRENYEQKYVEHVLTYDNDKVEVLTAYTDRWYFNYSKLIFTYKGGQIQHREKYYFDQTLWYKYYRVTYNYSGNHIKERELFYFDLSRYHGDKEIVVDGSKSERTYENNRLAQIDRYTYVAGDKWEYSSKDIFYREQSNIDSVITYKLTENDTWKETNKDEYHFYGYLLSGISNYHKYYTSYWKKTYTLEFDYDKNGNLNYEYDPTEGTYTYIYEEGSGNADEMFYYTYDFIELPSLFRSAKRQYNRKEIRSDFKRLY